MMTSEPFAGHGPELSVVIPTHNRRESLLRTLDALAQQSIAPARFEVVVALDATTDGTEQAVQERVWPFKVSLTISQARGAAANRNTGAAAAQGARLVFIDDDIVPAPDFLAAHLAAAKVTPGAVIVGNSAPAIDQKSWFHQALSEWWRALFAEMQAPEHRFTYQDLTSGNFSIPRALFFELGAFDTGFGTAAREDYEFGCRVIASGTPLRHAHAAVGLHHDASDLRKSLRRAKGEGAGDVILLRRHPTLFAWVRVSHLSVPRTGARVLRVLSYDEPWLGRMICGLATAALPVLEFMRMKGTWAKASLLARSLNYFAGVAQETGSRAGLRALADQAQAAGVPPKALELSLADGFATAAERVAVERPNTVSLYDGAHRVAFWPAVPGAEPLAPRHLQSQKAAVEWKGELVLASAQLMPPLPPDDPADIDPTVVEGRYWPITMGEVDMSGWTFLPKTSKPAYPMRLMLRAGAKPLGWLYIFAPGRDGRFWTAVREAIFADYLVMCRVIAALTVPTPPQQDLPPISVVICTRDRTDNLRRCLAAVERLDYAGHEVIIVDNAPTTDATRVFVEGLANPMIRYMREDRPGLDWARNCGVAAARHEIVAFTDDDTEVDRFWLQGFAGVFADSSISAATGHVAPMKLETDAQVYFEDVYGGMGKGFDPAVKDKATLGDRGILWASGFGVGANMAFRKAALAQVGPFDPALDVGTATRGGGDIEMFHRIAAAGLRLAYVPSAFVWHEHRSDGTALANQLRDNGSGFAAYLLAAARNRTVPRWQVLRFAVQDWIYGWLVKRWLRPGRHKRHLIKAEWQGMLKGYASYRTARKRAAELSKTGRTEA